METVDNMLEVREARKKYSHNNYVLKGVNLHVPRNSIYGLLGPSGCGKTTLLSCILGMKPLSSGEIRLSVRARREVGYMPQDVALFSEFTVEEILQFYGALFGLTNEQMKTRKAELKKLLDLPEWKQNIGTLSGGQQRRVSFAAALLHNPKLLLLDEPTVGVDPVLSYSMWQYLLKLSREGRTIIITTHYIEEAGNSHKIGMMRDGRIICEDTPKNILVTQNVKTLEEAFLKLSSKEVSRKTIEMEQEQIALSNLTRPTKVHLESPRINRNRLMAQILKNLIWMKGNRVIMFVLLLLPVMQSFFYSVSFGRDPANLKFLVISDELSPSKGFCNYDGPPYIGDLNCTLSKPFSCHYARELNKTFDIIFKPNLPEAELDVLSNKAWGLMYISSNFTDAVIGRLYDEIDVDEITLESSEILVRMDMSNYFIGQFMRKQIIDDLGTFLKNLAKSCGIPEEFASTPLRFMDPLFGGKEPLIAHSGLPGFYCSFCFYFPLIFTSGAIMMEKIVGTLERSMAAGMTYLEVIIAHLVVQFILMTVQKFAMYIVFYIWYDFPLVGDVKLIFAILYFIEMIGISTGFLFTECFSTDRLVTYAAIGATLSVFSLGGIIWPLEGSHFLIRSWVWAAPVTQAIQSYKDIASKGYDISYRSVYLGFVSCVCWTVILSLLAVIVRRLKK